jgi:hypothetical protein
MGERRDAYMVFVGKPKEKKPLSIPGVDWMIILKMYLTEMRYGCMDWIDWLRIGKGGGLL